MVALDGRNRHTRGTGRTCRSQGRLVRMRAYTRTCKEARRSGATEPMQACDYFSPALKNTLICVFQSECALWQTEHRERTMTGLFVVLLVGAVFAGLTWLMD